MRPGREVVARRRCSRCRPTASGRSCTPGAARARGCRSACRSARSIAASDVSCIHACRAGGAEQLARGVGVERRHRLLDRGARAGDLRGDRPPARRRCGRAPPGPTGRSRRGRPSRPGSAATTGRTARGPRRRPRAPAARGRAPGSRRASRRRRGPPWRRAPAPCGPGCTRPTRPARRRPRAADERREERVAGSASSRAWRDALAHLADRGDAPLRGRHGERLDVAVDGARQQVQPGGDVLPGLDRVGRHDVEDVAQLLHRGLDVVEAAQLFAGVVQLQVEPDALAHRGQRHPVDVVRRARARRAAARTVAAGLGRPRRVRRATGRRSRGRARADPWPSPTEERVR